MKFLYIILLLFVPPILTIKTTPEEKKAEERKEKILQKMIKARPRIQGGFKIETRHVAMDIFEFENYGNVTTMFYHVEKDIQTARFFFQVEELHLNDIGKCEPRHVIIHLKYASYPVVNPDGYPLLPNFVSPSKRPAIHTTQMLSNGNTTTISMTLPYEGIYYVMTYIKWEDPNTKIIKHEGLAADCHTILYTDLQVKKRSHKSNYPDTQECFEPIYFRYQDTPLKFKCITNQEVGTVFFVVNVLNNHTNSTRDRISIKITPEVSRKEERFVVLCAFDAGYHVRKELIPSLTLQKKYKYYTVNAIRPQYIRFITYPYSIYYLDFGKTPMNSSVEDCKPYFNLYGYGFVKDIYHEPLMRDDSSHIFSYDYGLSTRHLERVTSEIRVQSFTPVVNSFEIYDFLDIGGTLTISARLLYRYGSFMCRKWGPVYTSRVEMKQYYKVVICMNIGLRLIPLYDGTCKFHNNIKPALFVFDGKFHGTVHDRVVYPYPEAGLYYLTTRVFCEKRKCPYQYTQEKWVQRAGNGTTTPGTTTTEPIWRNGTNRYCQTTVSLSISSIRCTRGRCQNGGTCQLNTFSGLVFSYCSCMPGYGGWDCADGSRLPTRMSLIKSVVYLTVSNIVFLFPIYVGIIRLYFIEAMVYAFTMFFSTFYHACSANTQFYYCIMRLDILEFGDYFCNVLSFWMTFLAMAIISYNTRHFLQLTGVYVIALLTLWNMNTAVSFLIPLAFALSLIFFTWILDYIQQRYWRYPRSYYTTFLPLGIIILIIGLTCYGLYHTKSTYKVIHSWWHMITAVAFALLLPDIKRLRANPFLPGSSVT